MKTHRPRSGSNGLVRASIGGAPAAASAGQGQQPILHLLNERLVPPWAKLPAGRKDTALASAATGQLHKINCLVQHGARLLRIALEDQGRGDVPEDHRLVLLLAQTQSLRGLFERYLSTVRIVQAEMTGTHEPTELLPGKDPEHRVVRCHLRQVKVCAIQPQPGLPLLSQQGMRFRRKR
jgi:hypothetical protein